MANQEVKTLSQKVSGGQATIVQQVTQTLTEQDLLQQNQQLQFQQLQIKSQIQQLTDSYNSITQQIASNNDLLKQFELTDTVTDTVSST